MSKSLLITLALLALPAHADQAASFQQHCLESEALIASTRIQKAQGACAARGELSLEDEAQIASVQPTGLEPLHPLILTGLAAHRGQLSDEDIAQIESVRPADAIIYGRSLLR